MICWAVRMFIEDFLTPLMFARKALRLMNTNYLTALGTGPPFLFASNKMSYTELSHGYKIVNHAHTILGSIAIVQVDEIVARKAFTTKAVLNFSFSYLLTVLNFARDTGFCFETIVTSATGTCLFISYVCST